MDPTRSGAGQQPQPSRVAGWGRVCRRRGGSLRGGQGLLSPGAKCEKALGVPRHSTEVSLSVLWAPVSARWPGPHRTTVSLKTTRRRPRCACLQMPGPGRRPHPAPQPGNEVTAGRGRRGGQGRGGRTCPACSPGRDAGVCAPGHLREHAGLGGRAHADPRSPPRGHQCSRAAPGGKPVGDTGTDARDRAANGNHLRKDTRSSLVPSLGAPGCTGSGPRAAGGLGLRLRGGEGRPWEGPPGPAPPGRPPRPRAPPPFPGSGLWAFVSEGPEAPPAGRSGPRLLGQLRIRLRFLGRPRPRAPRWSRLRLCSRDASCKCPQPCSARSSPRTQRRTDGRRGWVGRTPFPPAFSAGQKVLCLCPQRL